MSRLASSPGSQLLDSMVVWSQGRTFEPTNCPIVQLAHWPTGSPANVFVVNFRAEEGTRVRSGAKLLVAVVLATAGWSFAQQPCEDCHGEPSFAMEDSSGHSRSLFVTDASLANSVHAGFGCNDCHAGVTEIPHAEKLPAVDCGTCHDAAQAEFRQSIHAKAEGNDAPACADCHGVHDIRAVADSVSLMNPSQQAYTCGRCHSDPRLVQKYDIPIKDPLKAYRNSVHGWLTLTKHQSAATCSSCHGGHLILAANEPTSTLSRRNIPKTCGQCHSQIATEYLAGVHGTALEKDVKDVPNCTDCHGEHGIERARAASAPTSARKLATETCGRCHASTRLMQKYGLAGGRLSTYRESYHGLALRTGNLSVANCASCHGIHYILPSSDPRSMIAPANLQRTCGNCHENASENFAKGSVHLTGEQPPALAVRLVRNFYVALIVLTIGGMLIHNGLDFVRKGRKVLQHKHKLQ